MSDEKVAISVTILKPQLKYLKEKSLIDGSTVSQVLRTIINKSIKEDK